MTAFLCPHAAARKTSSRMRAQARDRNKRPVAPCMNPHHKWYACRRCAGSKRSEDRSPPAAVNVRYRQKPTWLPPVQPGNPGAKEGKDSIPTRQRGLRC